METITLDGAQGEGGGQILRSALTLSMISGRAFRLERIRAGRARPGLLRQHLTAVQAAATISGAHVEGASPASQSLFFAPGPLRGGDYHFAIGSAGSCTLVLQTVLPALWYADRPATVTVSGGTHNPAAPPADFLIRAWLPLLRRMRVQTEIELLRHGFYPAGGGQVRAEVAPGKPLGLTLLERGAWQGTRATAIVAGVPHDVARRELAQLARRIPQLQGECRVLPHQEGPGNALLVDLEHAAVHEVFTGFGARGVSAEHVADRVAKAVRGYLDSPAGVGEHLADQLVLPLALAGSGSFSTGKPSSHLLTNLAVIGAFLPVAMHVSESGGCWRVDIGGAAPGGLAAAADKGAGPRRDE